MQTINSVQAQFRPLIDAISFSNSVDQTFNFSVHPSHLMVLQVQTHIINVDAQQLQQRRWTCVSEKPKSIKSTKCLDMLYKLSKTSHQHYVESFHHNSRFANELQCLDHILLKFKNQHRRAIYFHRLIEVKKKMNKLISLKTEAFLYRLTEIFQPNMTDPPQEIKTELGMPSLLEYCLYKLLSFIHIFEMCVDILVETASLLLCLLRQRFFLGFSVLVIGITSRFRSIVVNTRENLIHLYNQIAVYLHTSDSLSSDNCLLVDPFSNMCRELKEHLGELPHKFSTDQLLPLEQRYIKQLEDNDKFPEFISLSTTDNEEDEEIVESELDSTEKKVVDLPIADMGNKETQEDLVCTTQQNEQLPIVEVVDTNTKKRKKTAKRLDTHSQNKQLKIRQDEQPNDQETNQEKIATKTEEESKKRYSNETSQKQGVIHGSIRKKQFRTGRILSQEREQRTLIQSKNINEIFASLLPKSHD